MRINTRRTLSIESSCCQTQLWFGPYEKCVLTIGQVSCKIMKGMSHLPGQSHQYRVEGDTNSRKCIRLTCSMSPTDIQFCIWRYPISKCREARTKTRCSELLAMHTIKWHWEKLFQHRRLHPRHILELTPQKKWALKSKILSMRTDGFPFAKTTLPHAASTCTSHKPNSQSCLLVEQASNI